MIGSDSGSGFISAWMIQKSQFNDSTAERKMSRKTADPAKKILESSGQQINTRLNIRHF